MGKPRICFEIFQFIIFYNIFRISHDFQDHHVPAVGHDKCFFFAKRCVIVRVNLKAVLVDKFILGIPPVHRGKFIVLNEFIQYVIPDADEITHDIRRPDIQSDTAIVVNCGEFFRFINLKIRFDECIFQLLIHACIKESNVQHVIFFQHLFRNTQCFRNKPDGPDAAAFSITPVVHLHGWLEDIFPGYRNRTDKTGDAAAAFFFSVRT